jgi:hypothetical protein
MNKTTSPPSERGCLSSKDHSISDQPDIPTSKHNYLHKERLAKSLPSRRYYGLHISMLNPIHLEVIPDPGTEITLKKEMHPIFIYPRGAEFTVLIIRHFPMSSLQQISGV